MKKIIILLVVVFAIAASYDLSIFTAKINPDVPPHETWQEVTLVKSPDQPNKVLNKPHIVQNRALFVSIEGFTCLNENFYDIKMILKPETVRLSKSEKSINLDKIDVEYLPYLAKYKRRRENFLVFDHLLAGKYTFQITTEFGDKYEREIKISNHTKPVNLMLSNLMTDNNSLFQYDENDIQDDLIILKGIDTIQDIQLQFVYQFGKNNCEKSMVKINNYSHPDSLVIAQANKTSYQKPITTSHTVSKEILKDLMQFEKIVKSNSGYYSYNPDCGRSPSETIEIWRNGKRLPYIIRNCKFYLKGALDEVVKKYLPKN